MKLIAMEIPESNVEIAHWLESILCGGDLRGLVTQLSAMAQIDSQSAGLRETLGTELAEMLHHGLDSLSEQSLRELLNHPELLLELQELTMVRGGEYWQSRFKLDHETSTIERTRASIEGLAQQAIIMDRPPIAAPRVERTWRPYASVIRALAATLLIVAIGTYWITRPNVAQTTIAWGWASDDGIPVDISAQQYLQSLADGSDAWFKKTPSNSTELRKRLEEFIVGCSQLISAEHRPLNEADRFWLQTNCRSWKSDLEALLSATGNSEFDSVRKRADVLAKEISRSLRNHAVS